MQIGWFQTAKPGAWTSGTEFTYQWYANGTAIAGALLGTVFTHWMDQRHADWLQGQLDRGGILLWVRTVTTEREREALAILTRYSAHDIHIHEIPVNG